MNENTLQIWQGLSACFLFFLGAFQDWRFDPPPNPFQVERPVTKNSGKKCVVTPPHVMNISTIHGLCVYIYIYVIYVNIRWFLCNHPNPATPKLHLKRKEKTPHQLLQSEVPYCDFSSLGIGHAFLLGGFGKQLNPRPSDHVQQ